MPLLGLDQIKAQLNLEPEDTSEDNYLRLLGDAAARACELRTGRYIDPSDQPLGSLAAPFTETDLTMLRHAALIMVAEWYLNRENTGAVSGIAELPLAVTWLLDPLKDFADR